MATVNFKEYVYFSQSCSLEIRIKHAAKYRLTLHCSILIWNSGALLLYQVQSRDQSEMFIILKCFILVFPKLLQCNGCFFEIRKIGGFMENQLRSICCNSL
jgi:hypothetical protein